jgi:hypothetical protein
MKPPNGPAFGGTVFAAGTGLWVAHPDNPQVKEIVAPDEFVLRYVRQARWRFTERAYTAWLSTTLEQGVDA